MASIGNDSGGRRRILFVGVDGRRYTVRLGRISTRDAQAFRMRVERLVAAAILGQPADDDTCRWVATLPDKLLARLAAVGLAARRSSAGLKDFLDGYISSRSDVKAGTALVLGHARRNLIDHFGEGRSIRSITPGDADAWRLSLIASGLAINTVRRRCGIARQFFRAAQRSKLIAENPFADLACTIQGNAAKSHYITRTDADKVLQHCPDAQWRLIFALSRYGGLRCPSEHLALKWKDVDWAAGKLKITSPKTEHHEGGDHRYIPLFAELRAPLLEVLKEGGGFDDPIITRYRDTNCNLRTQLIRIIKRAGLKLWPKLFQNLRATRETELAETWPEHVVTKWIGHTSAVARKHYLQVTDEHFQKAAQIPAQQTAETSEIQTKANPQNPPQPTENKPLTIKNNDSMMSRLGLERLLDSAGNIEISGSAAQNAAQWLFAAWPDMPPANRLKILRLCRRALCLAGRM